MKRNKYIPLFIGILIINMFIHIYVGFLQKTHYNLFFLGQFLGLLMMFVGGLVAIEKTGIDFKKIGGASDNKRSCRK